MVAKILLIKKNRLSLHRLRATIELWCNGNTADFGSVILSSNLGSSTTIKGLFDLRVVKPLIVSIKVGLYII